MDQTPLTPAHPRQLTLAELQQLYPLDFHIDPTTRAVTVSKAWQEARLVQIEVIPGHHATVHRAAAPTFIEWLRRARLVGTDKCIETVDGGFNSRFKRGLNVPVSEAGLSRHARGTAIDLNAHANPQGRPAVGLGHVGCVLPLVPLAYDLGIVWGGDWHGSSCDPMHFEIGQR
jgi:hypothetical protein